MKQLFFFAFAGLLAQSAFSQKAGTGPENVGIGTDSPTLGKLEVVGVAGNGNTNAVFGSSSSGISLQQNWPTIGFNQYRNSLFGNGRFMSTGYAALQTMDPGSGTMVIDMLGNGAANGVTLSGSRGLTIYNNGNVGIHGDASSTASLLVTRGTNTDGSAIFQGTSYGSFFNYSATEDTYIRAGKSNGFVYINDVPGGKVQLGSGNSLVAINKYPTRALDIKQVSPNGYTQLGLLLENPITNDDWEMVTSKNNGANKGFLYFDHNGYNRIIIDPDNGDISSISDIRLKKDIQALPSVLNNVMQLRPVTYHMKDSGSSKAAHVGFIAQEVKSLFPQLVTVGGVKGEPNLNMVNYTAFGILAIKAIQEQQKTITNQAKEIDDLKHRLERLESRIQ